jgi:regulator of RNase E activity RraA
VQGMSYINLIQKLKNIPISNICDVSDNIRIVGNSISLRSNNPNMVGVARTVYTDCSVLPVIKALDNSSPGEVLVISSNSNYALAGEIFSIYALERKLSGIVINGFSRDSLELKNINLSYWSKGAFPQVSKSTDSSYSYQKRVSLGNTYVDPGDLRVSDCDGIIVGSISEFIDIIDEAEGVRLKERDWINRIKCSESLTSIFL